MSKKAQSTAVEAGQQMLAPRLRFPEFRQNWILKELGTLGKFYGGGTPSKSIPEYWLGDIPWVSSSDLFEDDIHNISITRHITEQALSESATKIVPQDSVLFVSRVGVVTCSPKLSPV